LQEKGGIIVFIDFLFVNNFLLLLNYQIWRFNLERSTIFCLNLLIISSWSLGIDYWHGNSESWFIFNFLPIFILLIFIIIKISKMIITGILQVILQIRSLPVWIQFVICFVHFSSS